MKSVETLLLELNALEIKVWDDGGYLGYSSPKGRLTPALREELLERKTEILTFLHQANRMTTLTLSPIQPGPKDADPPLSFAQQRLWFLDQLDGQSSPYNEVRAITLTGPLDVTALRQSLLEIIRRHQVLQTTFAIRKGTPVQVIAPHVAVPLEIIDGSKLPADEQAVRVQQRAVEEAQHHFDLTQGPLLRIILFQLGADSQVLVVTMHHIITDGWSIGVFVREMSLLYEAFATGAPSPLPELALQYADFAYWQRQWLRGETLERQLAYWREQLAGVPAVLALPTDRPRPPVQTFRGGSETFQLNPILTTQLKSLSQRSGATLFVTLLSAFATLLYRYSAQADIVVGSPIANRNRPEIEPLMGFIANTLVLRLRLHENASFSALLRQAQQVALDGYAHQDVPFEKLIEALQPERNLSHSPLFQVMFVFQNTPQEQFRLPGLTLTPLELEHVTAKFDLTLSMAETEQGLRGDLEYNSDLFDPSTIIRMIKHFQTLLAAIVADPEQSIATLPLLTAAERHQLLVEWNNTQVDYPQDQCLQQLFEAQVARTPEATALIFADEQLTYRELNGRANQLAHILQAAGVGPETLVGLCLERSVEMVIALLGILKAGGAYLPLDPSYPRERLAFMLADAQVMILLTQQKIMANLPEVSTKLICLDSDWVTIALESEQNPSSGVTPENLAYVIYTSGSTGQPKGAMNTHRGIVNRLLWMQDAYRLTPTDRVLQKTPFSFDVSVWEFFWPLLTGASLVVAKPGGHQDSAYLVELIAAQKITTLHFVPSMLQVFLEEQNLDRCQSLRQVICSGEALPFDLQNRFFARLDADLYNLYGPTEAAVDVTAWHCQRDSQQQFVPIGRPIANTQTYILDTQLQPVPPGISGELHLGGIALARGYLNRPDLTAERFIPNPFIQSRGAGEQGSRGELFSAPLPSCPPAPLRLYKTGDLARYLPDGSIEYLGRLDHQVKIRGFRIELGEVEATLNQHQAIRESVVVTWPEPNGSAGPRLVAYVVPHGEQSLVTQDLRHFLKEKLPDYMVPTSFVVLAELPLSPNGKLDRQALPAPDLTQRDLKADFAPPRSQTEALLAALWREVLGGVTVGIYDNFFELGGHSLLATQLMFRLRDTFRVELPLRRLFEEPTVAGLAALIETMLRQNGTSDQAGTGLLPQVVPDPVQRYQPFPLTDVQQAYWLGRSGIFELGNVSTHNYFELEGSGIDLEQASRAWQRLIEQHDMLRVVILADGQQQVLEQVPPYQIEVLDLRGLDGETVAAQLETVRQKMSHQVLPAEQWPLFQIRATRLADKRVRLHLSIDALMTDGWSVFTLSRDWFQLYLNPEQVLPPLELTFRDYVLAEQKLQETELVRRSEAYWFNRLDSLPPAPELPLAQRPGDLTQPRFKRRSDQLDPTAWQRLKQRASQAGLTASGVLLAVFAEILTTWSKSPRFTINLTLFNRLPLHPQVNDIVGDFTSLTLLEVDNSTAESFSSRAQRLQQQLWQDLDHRYVGGVRVLRELARRQGGQPVAMPIVFTSTLGQDVPTRNPHGELIYHISQTPQIWLDHQILEQDGKLVINWDALEDILPEGLWDEMFAAFFNLLRRLISTEATWTEPTRQLLPPAQLAQRTEVNDTATPVTDDLLHTLFITQAVARPAQTAIIAPDRCLSYQELFDRANHLDCQLRELDAQPNTLIAVVMEKGWEQVVAVLGILMSGAAYLPIDPDLPTERRHYLLTQGQVKLALTQPWLNHSLDWPDTLHRLIINDIELPSSIFHPPSSIFHPPSSSDLAYVIYTSGSTGLPKGVMIDHRGAVNTILDLNERFGITSHERVLALSALSFDLSVFDIFGTLAAGGTIVMPQATKDPAHWADLCRQHQVSLWNSVPALMQMLVDYLDGDRLPFPLRLIMLSGDWIPVTLPDQIKHLWPQAELYSLGGATEASIWSIFYPIHQVEPSWTSIPYGKPLRNQSFHVLNHLLEPCPIWVPGELYIGGLGLAQGYWRDEVKTGERFISHPQTGERLYKTGDLGRYLPDGNIEFLGREDFQVKIRGYRIELGEIEAALQQHPAVSEAVVTAAGQSRNHQHLIAYVVPEPSKSSGRFSEAYLPSADNGVIQDPLERAEFSLKQLGLRAAEPAQAIILLPKPEFDEPLTQAYLARQSYRHFLPEPIPLEQFSRFLSCLLQLSLPDALLPKYRYPSAGNLYPVQTYLYIKPNRVEGLSGGCYYYQPAGHELILLRANSALKDVASGANQAIFDQGAFWLFLVGELAAITPLYGDRARDFCLLEAGYMGQLLMHEAPGHHLGLCPIGYLDFDELQTLFGLASSQVLLHTFVGGGMASLQTNGGVSSSSSQPTLSLEAQLRAYLPQKLPDYMLPTTYILLETLPLTANGKVDRLALPAPQAGVSAPETGFVPPQTATEKILAEIWADILALEKVGIYDNFFEQGGNSLLATRLVARLRQTFPVDLPLRTFFESPTVAGIAQAIDTLVQAKSPSGPLERIRPIETQRLPAHLIALRSEGTKPPLFLAHPLAGLIFPYYELAGLLGDDQPVYGFQSVGLAGEAEPIAQIEAMAGHYLEALRLVQPEGPYFLAGWSLGGVIALELAQQLRRLGQTVALLAVIEPSPLVTPHKISTFFEASRYFFSMMGPRFWPYIHDYFSLLTAGGGQNRQIAPGSEAEASRGSYRQPELTRLWQIVQANVQASHHYVPQSYPGRIDLFQTGVSAGKNESNSKAGRWQQLAAEGLELHPLPGHHLNVLRQPYVKELAGQLAACLLQVHNGRTER